MANLSKIKRDNMINFLENLKKQHSDDASIRAFNEIENHLREKKYGLVWEEHSEQVDEMLEENIPVLVADKERRLCKDEKLPWNFIIEGDNLQALYLLQKTHKGKIDCIYIDPPYNTGNTNWKYNNNYVNQDDLYRHSKWLSMMYTRLHIAKEILSDNGVLICAIDENEYAHLCCILEEIFPSYEIHSISIIHNQKGVVGKNFAYTHEYAIFVIPSGQKVIGDKKLREDEIYVSNLRNWGIESLRSDAKNCFYPIIVKNDKIVAFGDVSPNDYHPKANEANPDGTISVYPVDIQGIERKWRYARQSVEGIKDILEVKKGRDGTVQIMIAKKYGTYKTVWTDKRYDAGEFGTKLLKKFLPHCDFDFPKSIWNVYDCLYAVVGNNKDAIILDFFAGSGTTGHAVNLLNSQDGGTRKFIMATNNEISAEEEKKFKSEGITPDDEKWQNKGIAKSVTWPRIVSCIEGRDSDGKRLSDKYLDMDISYGDGFKSNVKYFKCEWTPRKPEDYLLSNALCLHIKEMIELQNAIEVDNIKNVLILNKDDFMKTVLNKEVYKKIEHIWVNQNIVFNADELKLLQTKGFKYIPREFFGQEMKDAGE